MPALLVPQVMIRPVNRLPPTSLGVAASCTLAPTCTLAVAGLTATDATGGDGSAVTVTVAVTLWPSLVTVIVAVPTATPVTSPLPFTVASRGALLTHVTTRPVNGLPLASWVVAVSGTVCPTPTLADAGLTATDATDTAITETALESVRELPFCLAATRKSPTACPAV